MKPDLKVVPIESRPYDEKRGLKRLALLQRQLLKAAIRYIKEGKEDTWQGRLRTASSVSGIPRLRLEVEVQRS